MFDFRLIGVLFLVLAAQQAISGHPVRAAVAVAAGALFVFLDRRRVRQFIEARRRKTEARAKWRDIA